MAVTPNPLQQIFADIDDYIKDNFNTDDENCTLYWTLHYANTSKISRKSPKSESNFETPDSEESVDKLQRAITRIARAGFAWLLVSFRRHATDANPSEYPFRNPLSGKESNAIAGISNTTTIQEEAFTVKLEKIQLEYQVKFDEFIREQEHRAQLDALQARIDELENPKDDGIIAKIGKVLENPRVANAVAGVAAKMFGIDHKSLIGNIPTDADDETGKPAPTESAPTPPQLEDTIQKVFGNKAGRALDNLRLWIENNPEMAVELNDTIEQQRGKGRV
jgi:hypothetical protein